MTQVLLTADDHSWIECSESKPFHQKEEISNTTRSLYTTHILFYI